MKIVIDAKNESNSLTEVLEYFISYGYKQFILINNGREIKDLDLSYYSLNDIDVTIVNSFPLESFWEAILKIKGTIKDSSLLLVFSSDLSKLDLDAIMAFHHTSQKLVTLVETGKEMRKTVVAACENEILDYLSYSSPLVRIGEDDELTNIRIN